MENTLDDTFNDSAFEWTFAEPSLHMKKILDDDSHRLQVKPNLTKPVNFHQLAAPKVVIRTSYESSHPESKSVPDGSIGSHGPIHDINSQFGQVDKPMTDFPSDEIERLKQGLVRWDFDIFSASRLTDGHVMQAVAYEIVVRHNLLQDMKINEYQFMRFIIQVEKHYRRHPYHNASHAADVLQTVYCIIHRTGFLDFMTPLELFSILVTAAVHDIEHTGTNNTFHKNSGSEMSKLYMVSILENHHLRVGLRMVQEFQLLKQLGRADFEEFKSMLIMMILSTDMSNHFLLLTNMRLIVGTVNKNPIQRLRIQRIMMLILHAADISNSAKTWDQHKVWVTLLCEEFFRQGDKEKELHLPISASCDRNVTNIATLQIGFMQTFTKETFEVMDKLIEKTVGVSQTGKIVQPYHPWQECMQENLEKWSGKWKSLKYEQINELLCETEKPRMSIAYDSTEYSKIQLVNTTKPRKCAFCRRCCRMCGINACREDSMEKINM